LRPIPVPKARNKARYSVVLIGATGQSHQLELTPWRLRLGLGIVAAVIVVGGLAAISSLAFRTETTKNTARDENLIAQVSQLQDELRQKELALKVQEKRLKEMQELPTLAAVPPRPSRDVPSPQTGGEVAAEEGGPLLALQEPKASDSALMRPSAKPTDQDASDEESKSQDGAGEDVAGTSGAKDPSAKLPIINFNAQRVTAVAESQSKGTLSFQLVKDRHDIRFSGYLFVFVEMVDGKENKIYAYPKRARMGEEDLPADFREGESVSFKYNSRVELPYVDVRPDAHLASVSILLYGQNGKIVFQRAFDRREVKTTSAKAGTDGRPAAASGEKRRAL
jgi:hypothetical protein